MATKAEKLKVGHQVIGKSKSLMQYTNATGVIVSKTGSKGKRKFSVKWYMVCLFVSIMSKNCYDTDLGHQNRGGFECA